MKTTIARVLLASTPIVAPPVLQEKLGQRAYSEALRLGWIAPDTELSCLRVSSRGDHRAAMLEAAKPTEAERLAEANAPAPAAVDAARRFYGAPPVAMHFTIVEDAPAPAVVPGVAPAGAPPVGAAPKSDDPAVGDQVTVAEGGQTYTARVQALNTDGSVKLTFSGAKPPRSDFKANEIKVTGKGPAAGGAVVVAK